MSSTICTIDTIGTMFVRPIEEGPYIWDSYREIISISPKRPKLVDTILEIGVPMSILDEMVAADPQPVGHSPRVAPYIPQDIRNMISAVFRDNSRCYGNYEPEDQCGILCESPGNDDLCYYVDSDGLFHRDDDAPAVYQLGVFYIWYRHGKICRPHNQLMPAIVILKPNGYINRFVQLDNVLRNTTHNIQKAALWFDKAGELITINGEAAVMEYWDGASSCIWCRNNIGHKIDGAPAVHIAQFMDLASVTAQNIAAASRKFTRSEVSSCDRLEIASVEPRLRCKYESMPVFNARRRQLIEYDERNRRNSFI